MDTFQKNYEAIEALVGEDLKTWVSRAGRVIKRKSSGFMDLTIETLGNGCISLTHYYEQTGDLVPDPDMKIQIHPETQIARALHFQNSLGYWEVYPEEGKVHPFQLKAQNEFLTMWLRNLKAQGFYPKKGG